MVVLNQKPGLPLTPELLFSLFISFYFEFIFLKILVGFFFLNFVFLRQGLT